MPQRRRLTPRTGRPALNCGGPIITRENSYRAFAVHSPYSRMHARLQDQRTRRSQKNLTYPSTLPQRSQPQKSGLHPHVGKGIVYHIQQVRLTNPFTAFIRNINHQSASKITEAKFCIKVPCIPYAQLCRKEDIQHPNRKPTCKIPVTPETLLLLRSYNTT